MGGGAYDWGTEATLTAIPDSGYAFSYWTGAAESIENPLVVRVDVPKTYTAVFEPLPIAFTGVESSTNGVALAWNNLAWATHFLLYRGITSVPSSATVLADIPNTGECTFFDETGDVDVEYWYWIEAEGPEDGVMSEPMTGTKLRPIVFSPITYTGLKGASNPNPEEYQEGMALVFAAPGAVKGYTFKAWVPSGLGVDATGAQTVKATWTANKYSIAYDPNGGSGTMEPTACTYGKTATVASNAFVREGYRFAGWGTSATGGVVYAEGQGVKNLASASGAVVTFYAVWAALDGPEVLSGSADPRLAEKITTAEAYEAFRTWLEEKGLDLQAVKDSPHAWPSFVLGPATLLANEPTIQIGGISFATGEAKSADAAPSLEIRVTVNDGEAPAAVDATKVAALFAATGNPADWESTPLPVEASQSGSEDDTLLFQVTPGTGTEPAIFLRLSD